MEPAKVKTAGEGLRVDDAVSHPAGILFSGGYDAETNELYLAGAIGHPRGVVAAGGDPSSEHISGLRVLIVEDGTVYWATDSMSLPRGLDEVESATVQTGLERYFSASDVRRVERLEDIPPHRSN